MFSTTLPGASGSLPDLLSLLRATYRTERGIPEGAADPSDAFLAWAQGYLTQHRPSEVFAVDNNYGLQLTNGQRLQLSPDAVSEVRQPGDMANPDSSIAIMQAR
jgi:hypothetical protein